MANLELEGKLAQKLAVQSGKSAKGEWSKQEFVLEFQDGSFSNNAVFSIWGIDKVKDFERFAVGSNIRVSFSISSREYMGKWYTDLRAWRIQNADAQPMQKSEYQQARPASNTGTQYNDVPAGFAPKFSSDPGPSIDDMPGDNGEDDLPF